MNAPKLKPPLPNSAHPDATGSDLDIKKVKPYPIACSVARKEGEPPFPAHILKMTEIGFLMKVGGDHFFKVGEKAIVEFELPVFHQKMKHDVKVIKTYHAFERISEHKTEKVFTVEMHFVSLKHLQKVTIKEFIQKIGQK
jgi:hypothetical protein